MLRDYQATQKNEIYESWGRGNRNVLSVLPTGAGKTVVMSDIAREVALRQLKIAHRQELVGQISCALAACGIPHDIVAPSNIVGYIVTRHQEKFGRSFYYRNAHVAVAGVDTFLRREIPFLEQVGQWDVDEAHHLLRSNKWGRAVARLPNARGIGWTATPERADRRALGRAGDGVFDDMVVGPTMRELIDAGYLCDFVIYGPPMSIVRDGLRKGKSGDFTTNAMHAAAARSTIVGDVVDCYLRFAAGKRGVTFAIDRALSEEHAAAFRHRGVPAEIVTAKTPDHVRDQHMSDLACGLVKQLINVDILGEGVDVPVLEVVSMARPTDSYALFAQQFGRPLRLADLKNHGIVIDHVGNVAHHGGPPDDRRDWTLDAPERKGRDEIDLTVPVRNCVNDGCWRVYEGYSNRCPYCRHVPEPEARSRPEFVEGDLTLYDADLLKSLREEAEKIVAPGYVDINGRADKAAIAKNMKLRSDAQVELRGAIAQWAGIYHYCGGESDDTIYRRFWHTFGIDVATAQTLGRPEAERLTAKLRETMT